MAFKIIFTKRAKANLSNIAEYLESEWSKKVADKFVKQVFEAIDLLAQNPKIGPIELEEQNLRALVIRSQVKMLYRIKERKVTIISIFDTRQSPSKLKGL